MKPLLNGLVVLALLVACNGVAAATMWSVASLLALLFPALTHTFWPWFVAGLTGIAAAVYFLFIVISRAQRRGRARVPA